MPSFFCSEREALDIAEELNDSEDNLTELEVVIDQISPLNNGWSVQYLSKLDTLKRSAKKRTKEEYIDCILEKVLQENRVVARIERILTLCYFCL